MRLSFPRGALYILLPPYFSARSGRFYFVLFSVIHCFPSFIRLFILYVGLYFFTGFVRFYTFLPKRLCSFLMEETNQRPLRGKTCDVFPLRTPFCTPQGEYPLKNPPDGSYTIVFAHLQCMCLKL